VEKCGIDLGPAVEGIRKARKKIAAAEPSAAGK
jgi:hypothetical protein